MVRRVVLQHCVQGTALKEGNGRHVFDPGSEQCQDALHRLSYGCDLGGRDHFFVKNHFHVAINQTQTHGSRLSRR